MVRKYSPAVSEAKLHCGDHVCLPEMVEDKRGAWVALADYEALQRHVVSLEAHLSDAIDNYRDATGKTLRYR